MILQNNKQYHFIDMITMSIKTSPFYSTIIAFKTILDAIIPTFQIFITAEFINLAITVVNGKAEISSIYVQVTMLAIIMLYDAIKAPLVSFLECKRRICFRNKLIPELIQKQTNLKYCHIENTDTANLISRIMGKKDFSEQIWDMFVQVLNTLKLIIYILGILITLFTQVWWIAITMLVVTIPLMYIATKAGKKSYEADKKMAQLERKSNYLSNIMKERTAVEERSIYGYTDELNKRYFEAYEDARKYKQKIMTSNFIKMKCGGIFTTAYSTIVMLALISPVVNGSMSIGMFIAILGAVFGLEQQLSWGINGLLEDLSKKMEYLHDLTNFVKLNRDSDSVAEVAPNMSFKVIEFKNVSFHYPETEKIILDDISFKIEANKHYSFVGINGAGKTTLIKLITGLYDNYDGEILVDGKSLRDLTQAEIKGLSAVVYQDFAKYYISVYDNIAIANLGDYNNCEEVERVIDSVGLRTVLKRLKMGLDTPLGKIMENGVDFSGGEWQRVAMARAIIGDNPLIILDEPTAALDPVSENMVYNNFKQISNEKTTIFISHRLASTKLADVIYVLCEGKIVERGSHKELMSRGGIYRKMYNSQANWYKNDKLSGKETFDGSYQEKLKS